MPPTTRIPRRTMGKHVALHLVPCILRQGDSIPVPGGRARCAASTPRGLSKRALQGQQGQPLCRHCSTCTRHRGTPTVPLTYRAHVDEAAGLELCALALVQLLAVHQDGAGRVHVLWATRVDGSWKRMNSAHDRPDAPPAISVAFRTRSQAGAVDSRDAQHCILANQFACAHCDEQDAGGVQRVGAAFRFEDQVHTAAAGQGRQVKIHRHRRRQCRAVQGRVRAQDVRCKVVPAPGTDFRYRLAWHWRQRAAQPCHSAPVVQDAHVDGLGALALKVPGCQRAHALAPNVARQVDLRLGGIAGSWMWLANQHAKGADGGTRRIAHEQQPHLRQRLGQLGVGVAPLGFCRAGSSTQGSLRLQQVGGVAPPLKVTSAGAAACAAAPATPLRSSLTGLQLPQRVALDDGAAPGSALGPRRDCKSSVAQRQAQLHGGPSRKHC